MEPILSTSKLTKRYGNRLAVRDIDLDVADGEIYGFLGPNGAGKTTTIKLLLALIRPMSGAMRIFGQDVRRHSTRVKRGVGYLPGELHLYDHLTPSQLFNFSASLCGVGDLAYAIQLSERLGLDGLGSPVGQLSLGQKQKVGLIQALLHRPRLAILDEPTNGLDPLVRHEFFRILREAREAGMTIFFSSHVLSEAEQICDRVAIIRAGELVRVGLMHEFKALAPRRLRLVFDGQAPVEPFSRVPGVVNAEASVSDGGGGRVLDLRVRSHVDDVIKLAAQYPVADFYSEEPSLEDIFLEYYDAPSPDVAPDATDTSS